MFDPSFHINQSLLQKAVRDSFNRRGYLEVHTPLLTPSPIPEPHIELFKTARVHPDGTEESLYLTPSPEVWMKTLLASGAPSIYSMAPCFRNKEPEDSWHRSEFSMLEWYRIGASAEDNIEETRRLLTDCLEQFKQLEQFGKKQPEDISGSFRILSMEDAFQTLAGFSLENDLIQAGLADTASSQTLYRKAREKAGTILRARAAAHGLGDVPSGEDAADTFHRLFVGLVEERLPGDKPLILTHWPALIPTLAKRIPQTPYAERWELYIRGVEVANCFGEENNPQELAAYWEQQTGSSSTDKRWIETISRGMPPCSGTALGLDRLLALICGQSHIASPASLSSCP